MRAERRGPANVDAHDATVVGRDTTAEEGLGEWDGALPTTGPLTSVEATWGTAAQA